MTFLLWYIYQLNGTGNVLVVMNECYSKCWPKQWIVQMNNVLRILLQWHYSGAGLSIQVFSATRSGHVKPPASLRIPHLKNSGGLHNELNGKCYIMAVLFFRIATNNAVHPRDNLPSDLLRPTRPFHISLRPTGISGGNLQWNPSLENRMVIT